MKLALLATTALAGFAALAGPASARMPVSNRIIASAGCMQGNTYADGCPGAAAGTAQFPTLFTGLIEQAYPVRPPLNVAGVDYQVGVPTGTALKDPTTASLPSGCTFSGTTVTCSSGSPTLNGFDFGLHNGTLLHITGGSNIVVQNSHFLVGSNMSGVAGGGPIYVTGGTNLSFLNNEMDGNNVAVTAQQGQTIYVLNGNGNLIFRYNYMHNSGGDMLDIYGGTWVNLVQYNVFKDIGVNTAHSDGLEYLDAHIQTGSDIGFNLAYQTVNMPGAGDGLIMPLSEGNASSVVSGLLVHNNTMIAESKCTACNFGIGFFNTTDIGAATSDHVAVFDNYLDFGAFQPATFVGSNPVITSNNHLLAVGDIVLLQTTGTAPGGFSANGTTQYYVIATGYTANTIELSATLNGSAITPTNSGSGTINIATGPAYNTGAPWFPVASYSSYSFAIPQANHDLLNIRKNTNFPPISTSGAHEGPWSFYTSPDPSGYTAADGDAFTYTPSPASGTVTTGNNITITLALAENWTITGGTPTISLNSGGAASYTSGSGTNSLVFTYTVGAGDSANPLAITAFNFNGATIKDGFGNSFVFNPTMPTHTYNGLAVSGVVAPTVASNVASPASGSEGVGATVTMTLTFSTTVTVAGGTPTLSLNNGGAAAYTSGSGTNVLVYKYTVGATDASVTPLQVTASNLNGATITHAGTNANMAGALVSFTGLNVNVAPTISSIVATPGNTTATVTWTTNEPATSVLNYGTTTGYGSNVSSGTLVTSHSLNVSGLSSSQQYHFDVTSVDGNGNSTTSPDPEFETRP